MSVRARADLQFGSAGIAQQHLGAALQRRDQRLDRRQVGAGGRGGQLRQKVEIWLGEVVGGDREQSDLGGQLAPVGDRAEQRLVHDDEPVKVARVELLERLAGRTDRHHLADAGHWVGIDESGMDGRVEFLGPAPDIGDAGAAQPDADVVLIGHDRVGLRTNIAVDVILGGRTGEPRDCVRQKSHRRLH